MVDGKQIENSTFSHKKLVVPIEEASRYVDWKDFEGLSC